MRPDRRRLAATFAFAIGMLMPPGVAAAAPRHPRPKPDLKVVVLQANFGSPAYRAVGTDGVMDEIEVRVGVKNQGAGAAAPSTTNVFFQDSKHHHFQKKVVFPRLGPHTHPHYEIVDITGTKPALGFAQLGAVADFNEKQKESDENNNFLKGEQFVIIARQWNVPSFATIVKAAAAVRTTKAGSDFHFEFYHYDHAAEEFVYTPNGSITSTTTYSGFCSGTGSTTATHTPWAGFLDIRGDFRTYDAFVKVDPTKYSVPLVCFPAFNTTGSSAADDLDVSIGGGFPHTNEQARQVSGDVTDGSVESKWQFRAAIP
jgi:hypothetical protein